MPRPTNLILAALAVSLVPIHGSSQQLPQELSVNALQVRRACMHPQRDPALRGLCGLSLPRGAIRARKDWRAWTDTLAKYREYRLAESIQRYSTSLPQDSLTVWQVYFGLDQAQRDSAVLRFGKNDRMLNAMRRLSLATKRELVELVIGTDSTPAAPGLSSEVAGEFQNAALATRDDAAQVFDQVMKKATDLTRLRVLSLLESARDTVASEILDSIPVSVLLDGKDSKSYLSEGVRQSAQHEYASAAGQPVGSGRAMQSSLVWGTTDFVVERVQQQFQLLAVEGYLNRLCQGSGARTLRNTCSMIRSNRTGISRAGATLLRSAVYRDLEALPYTSLDYAYSEFGSQLTRPQADALQFATRVADFTLQVARGTDPLLALTVVADSFRVAAVEHRDAIETRVGVLGQTVERLRSTTTPAARDSLQRLQRELAALRVDLPAADIRARRALVSADSSRVASVLLGLAALSATRFDPLRMHSVEWVGSTPRELLLYELIAMAANYQPNVRQAASYMAFEPWNVVPVALAVEDEIQQLRVRKNQLDEARAAHHDTAGAVRQARTALIRGAFALVDQVLFETSQIWADAHRVQRARQANEGIQAVVFPMVEGNYAAGLLALNGQVSAYFDSIPTLDSRTRANFTRGITFVSELAGASDAGHVNAALVRLTDSGDGYVGKRRSHTLRFTLNAFGGAYGGFESAGEETSPFGGVYLPVGLAMTAPWNVGRPFGSNVGTLGLFLQAVDLGALASWRLDADEEVGQRPEVGFAQVFSPGAFVVLNVSGAPLTFGYGFSWAPELRSLKDGDSTGSDRPNRVTAWRHGLFVAFDIPIFP